MLNPQDPPRDALLAAFRHENGRLWRLDGTRQPRRNCKGRKTVMVPGYGQRQLSRMLWIFVNGEIPDGLEVDHKDGDGQNNDIGNLRLATSSQQKMNRKCQSNNRAGLRGAFYHAIHRGKKWRSQIKAGGKVIFLGYFHTAEEASAAHADAAKKYFGEFYSPRVRRQPSPAFVRNCT